jgi:hypothetical protein
MNTRHASLLAATFAALLCAGQAHATPQTYGYGTDEDEDSVLQADTDGLSLQAGQFTWLEPAQARPGSPVTMLVSLSEQRGFLYRDGRRIAVTTLSTGVRGHDTPAGVFPITQKERVHHSNKYNNAPMPYMQRLTRWGHALHAGQVRPGPASHGCVRLPAEFAKQLFSMTQRGDLVVISQDLSPQSLARAGANNQIGQQLGVAGLPDRPAVLWRDYDTPAVAAETAGGANGVTAY